MYFLPSVVCLKVNIDYFRRLNQEPKIFNILLENLETLILSDMGFFSSHGSKDTRLTVTGAERISGILRKLCKSKNLKAVCFECQICTEEYDWERENVSLVLNLLDMDNTEAELDEAVCLDGKGQFESDEELVTERHGIWDDASSIIAVNKCHKVDETWTDFTKILTTIDHARKRSHVTKSSEEHTQESAAGNIESVSLCVNCFLYVGKYLPHCKSVRRLALEGSVVKNTLNEGM